MESRVDAVPWGRRAHATCPVEPKQRGWIETKMLWLRDQFGIQAARGE